MTHHDVAYIAYVARVAYVAVTTIRADDDHNQG